MFLRLTRSDLPQKRVIIVSGIIGLLLLLPLGVWSIFWNGSVPQSQTAVVSDGTVTLTQRQLASFKIAPAGEEYFSPEKEAFGSIDFNEDRSVQVYPSYQGKIISTDTQLGQRVRRGELLYTIQSPDLIQAESTLISSAATLAVAKAALQRAKLLLPTQGIAQKDYDQAVADEKTAEGTNEAARNAMRVFGKSEAQIDHLLVTRVVDQSLDVLSPVSGFVTARNAQPGLLAQPGVAPPPFVVSDLSTKWMLAYVDEGDSPLYHVGEKVAVTVPAYPGHAFSGTISVVGAMVDPNTHRITLRSIIEDPKNQLRPGMLANFVIHTAAPARQLAVPDDALVREGDGTMTVWTTVDRHAFHIRTVRIGMRQNGYVQILSGLSLNELVVTDGAVFLSNMLESPPSD